MILGLPCFVVCNCSSTQQDRYFTILLSILNFVFYRGFSIIFVCFLRSNENGIKMWLTVTITMLYHFDNDYETVTFVRNAGPVPPYLSRGSTPTVGSSSMSRSGWCRRARAREARRCWPPESCSSGCERLGRSRNFTRKSSRSRNRVADMPKIREK